MSKEKLVLLACLVISLSFLLSGCGPTNQPPTATFTSNTTNLEASLDASGSSDPDGSIVSYSWNLGDGSTASGVSVSHQYNSAGSYNVELTITDNDGAQDTSSKTISVTSPSNLPTASFTANPTSGEAPLEVTFDASNSSDSNGSITSYDWVFGDGSTGAGVTIDHTFTSSGNYTVELTVTDNDGGSDSTTESIEVSSSDGDEDGEELEILNWSLEKQEYSDYAIIVGEVKNVSGEEIDSATVAAKFFDASDKRLEISYDSFFDLSPGVTADLEIISLTEYSKVDHVDVYVDSVNIYSW